MRQAAARQQRTVRQRVVEVAGDEQAVTVAGSLRHGGHDIDGWQVVLGEATQQPVLAENEVVGQLLDDVGTAALRLAELDEADDVAVQAGHLVDARQRPLGEVGAERQQAEIGVLGGRGELKAHECGIPTPNAFRSTDLIAAIEAAVRRRVQRCPPHPPRPPARRAGRPAEASTMHHVLIGAGGSAALAVMGRRRPPGRAQPPTRRPGPRPAADVVPDTADELFDQWAGNEPLTEVGVDGRPRRACGSPTSAAWKRSNSASTPRSSIHCTTRRSPPASARRCAAACCSGATRMRETFIARARRARRKLLRRRTQRRPRDVDRQERAQPPRGVRAARGTSRGAVLRRARFDRATPGEPAHRRGALRNVVNLFSPSSTAPMPTTMAYSSSAHQPSVGRRLGADAPRSIRQDRARPASRRQSSRGDPSAAPARPSGRAVRPAPHRRRHRRVSGADLSLVCEQATERAMSDSIRSGTVRPISQPTSSTPSARCSPRSGRGRHGPSRRTATTVDDDELVEYLNAARRPAGVRRAVMEDQEPIRVQALIKLGRFPRRRRPQGLTTTPTAPASTCCCHLCETGEYDDVRPAAMGSGRDYAAHRTLGWSTYKAGRTDEARRS